MNSIPVPAVLHFEVFFTVGYDSSCGKVSYVCVWIGVK